MKTQYYTAATLDGFLATEDDSLDWLFPLGNVNNSSYPKFISEIGAIAMGASTYKWMLNNADLVSKETGSSWPYDQPTWVFTNNTLTTIEGANIQFVHGSVEPIYHAMCEHSKGKNIWVVGGGDLAGQFYDAGLLDEIIVQIGSVTLGKGKPLFPREVLSPILTLISVDHMDHSMIELRYAVQKHD